MTVSSALLFGTTFAPGSENLKNLNTPQTQLLYFTQLLGLLRTSNGGPKVEALIHSVPTLAAAQGIAIPDWLQPGFQASEEDMAAFEGAAMNILEKLNQDSSDPVTAAQSTYNKLLNKAKTAPLKNKKEPLGEELKAMSVQERVGVGFYTSEGFSEMNSALRALSTGDNSLITSDLDIVMRVTMSGLNKLNSGTAALYNGISYRGIDAPDMSAIYARYQPNTTVVEPAFTSSSKTPSAVDKFFDLTGEKENTRFIITSRPGGTRATWIEKLSVLPGQEEVVYPPNTSFNVTDTNNVLLEDGTTRFDVYMEEDGVAPWELPPPVTEATAPVSEVAAFSWKNAFSSAGKYVGTSVGALMGGATVGLSIYDLATNPNLSLGEKVQDGVGILGGAAGIGATFAPLFSESTAIVGGLAGVGLAAGMVSSFIIAFTAPENYATNMSNSMTQYFSGVNVLKDGATDAMKNWSMNYGLPDQFTGEGPIVFPGSP